MRNVFTTFAKHKIKSPGGLYIAKDYRVHRFFFVLSGISTHTSRCFSVRDKSARVKWDQDLVSARPGEQQTLTDHFSEANQTLTEFLIGEC